jgi:DNA-binding MarR family transcriptional regulator
MEAVTHPETSAEQSLGMVLKRAEQTLVRAKSAAVKDVGLTLAQYVALAELHVRPGVTGAALARSALVTPQAMMVVLKTLEEQGLIERRRHPRHESVLEVYLTDPGREALHAASQLAEPIETRIQQALSSSELKVLRELLLRTIDALQER